MRMKSKGRTDAELVNMYVPYVICEGSSTHYAERAFAPDEIAAQRKFSNPYRVAKDRIPDVQWYI